MDTTIIMQAIEGLSNEKGLSRNVVIEAIQEGLESATKKRLSEQGLSENCAVRIDINPDTCEYVTYRRWQIVEDDDLMNEDVEIPLSKAQKDNAAGDWVEEQMESVEFSRIASNHAIPVIRRKIQEATRLRVAEQFKPLVGQIVQGTIKKIGKEAIIVDLGDSADGILRRENTIPNEILRINERIRALLLDIEEEPSSGGSSSGPSGGSGSGGSSGGSGSSGSSGGSGSSGSSGGSSGGSGSGGSQLILSRTGPEMLRKLFHIEVPEISEGVIELRAVARIAGSRSKIAVSTKDHRIDPVGACVGMRGSRVQAVSNQLYNERIDVVLWDENLLQLAAHAMAPAKVLAIFADEENYMVDIAVSEEDLSQAIGRLGENVRLAEDLTGLKLNIMTEEALAEKQKNEQEAIKENFVKDLDVDEDIARALIEDDFTLTEEIADADLPELMEIPGIDEDIAAELQSRAKDAMAKKEVAEEGDAEVLAKLLELPGMTTELLDQLAEEGIKTLEDIADLDTFELTEKSGTKLDEKQAGELIMSAREHCSNEPEESEDEPVESEVADSEDEPVDSEDEPGESKIVDSEDEPVESEDDEPKVATQSSSEPSVS